MGTASVGHSIRADAFRRYFRHAGKKRRALEAYKEEMRAFPHPRSFEAVNALAAWRGASAGLNAAEAFMVVREVAP